jgi:polysaccharide biosynthesis/export protein
MLLYKPIQFNIMNKRLQGFLLFVAVLLIASSCTTTKTMVYFNDLEKVKQAALLSNPQDNAEHKLERNDILSIRITSPTTEDKAWLMLNQSTGAPTTTLTTSQFSGYLISAEGNIDIPLVGTIKAAGLSMNQLKETIIKQILDKRLLVDPNVEIRFLNYEISVLGEVARPMVINVPSEKISLLKALSIAGDITPYGKRDNVMLIRESEGKKVVTRINLGSSTFLQSPFYYLQPNDVVYVETTQNRAASIDKTRLIVPSILSAISVGISIYYLTRK